MPQLPAGTREALGQTVSQIIPFRHAGIGTERGPER
jgi:hypothetical protein